MKNLLIILSLFLTNCKTSKDPFKYLHNPNGDGFIIADLSFKDLRVCRRIVEGEIELNEYHCINIYNPKEEYRPITEDEWMDLRLDSLFVQVYLADLKNLVKNEEFVYENCEKLNLNCPPRESGAVKELQKFLKED